ncbi:ATP-binding protein [Streptomyces sediminimaris]|uniref:ATP-binding protein n=1 Tax=Streptomyces sediminimaris TaxID=3383721 RepID=UPI0039998DFD
MAAGVVAVTALEPGHVVTERAASAVRHARRPGRPFDVALAHDGGKPIESEVFDRSKRHPCVSPHDPDATSGRGLLPAQALCDAWGVRDREFGKPVRARVVG